MTSDTEVPKQKLTPTPKAKPRTPKPMPLAFVADEPCARCGCEWAAPSINVISGETCSMCANPYCRTIETLRANLKAWRTVAGRCWNMLDPDEYETLAREVGVEPTDVQIQQVVAATMKQQVMTGA